MDIRVERTYNMLFEALTNLLSCKRLGDITVNELCARSTVHRATFYKHFDDKYDFYRCYLEHLGQSFVDNAPQGDALEDVHQYCHHMLIHLLGFLNSNIGIIKRFADDATTGMLLDMVVRQMAQGVADRLQARLDEDPASASNAVSPMLLAVFYSGGLIQVLRWWIGQDKPLSEKELVAALDGIDMFGASSQHSQSTQAGTQESDAKRPDNNND